MIATEIERSIKPGTVIPKPAARADFIVKGWGTSRGELALVYTIPNRKNPSDPYTKRITRSDFQKAFDRLTGAGNFSREWFEAEMPDCAKGGPCNFTTIGGIFMLLGWVEYAPERGRYRLVHRGATPNQAGADASRSSGS